MEIEALHISCTIDRQHSTYYIGNMFVLELLLDYKIHRFINTKKKHIIN